MEGETWQDNYSVVSNVEVNGRTAFSVATEPGDARHAFKSSGRRRSAGWFTVPSSQRPLVSDQRSLGEVTGVTERRCARLLIGITRVRIPAPVSPPGTFG